MEESLDNHEEEVSSDEKDASEDVFCIHNVKINTSDDRPECRKCRKNYYKILNTDCPHYTKREYCFNCERKIDGWIYKT